MYLSFGSIKTMEGKMNDEIVKILIQEKLSFLNTVANSYMLWWVSSILFCGSVLSTVWVKQKDILKIKNKGIDIFFNIANFLFILIIGFGIFGVIGLSKVKSEYDLLIESIGIPMDVTNFEFPSIQIGIIMGTTSFFFVLIIWNLIYLHLRNSNKVHKEP
jgi:uncharacterized membrane protein YgdD (TMEM256/DUF423 family)